MKLEGSDELGIRRTLASYCHHVDDGRITDLVDLFAPDGCFVLDAKPITGRAELLRFFDERQGRAEQRGRHLTLNTVVAVTGATARARSDFFFLKYVDGRLTPVRAGRYEDELVRIDGTWRFARRRVEDWIPVDA
jgi:hypothetical protein